MSQNFKVLIVDDDKLIGEMLKVALGESGNIDVDYVTNGRDGIAKVREAGYDVVFMDVIMPEMNGVETLEKIREFNKEIPVVMITGYSVSEMLTQAKKLGAHSSLSKPVSLTQITKCIEDIVGSKSFDRKKEIKCLVIDERSNADVVLFSALESEGAKVRVIDNCGDLYSKENPDIYDLIVVNIDMSNPKCADWQKKIMKIKDKTMMLLGAEEEENLMEKAFGLNAVKYIYQSAPKSEIADVLKQFLKKNKD